jgi:hypothetical protein
MGGSKVSSASDGKKKSSYKFWKKSKRNGKSLVSIQESSEIASSSVANNKRQSNASTPVVPGNGTALVTPDNGPSNSASSSVNDFPQYVDIAQKPWGSFQHGASIVNFRHPAHADKAAAAAAAQNSKPQKAVEAATFTHMNGTNNNGHNASHSMHKPHDSHGTLKISNSMLEKSDEISALPSPSPLPRNNINSQRTQQHRTSAGDHVSILTDPTGFYDNHDDDESSQVTSKSSMSDFFGKFSFMSGLTEGTLSPSPQRRTNNKNKLNLLPPIVDSVAGSGSGSRGSHLSPRDVYNTMPGSSPSMGPRTPAEASKAALLLLKESQKKQGNWLTRSKAFANLTKWAFDQIDDDGSGQVDKKELYTGLLIIHLELAKYVGAAACRPMPRSQVYELFDKLDADHSGTLSKEEFASVMVIMCSQLLTRVIVLFGSTLMLVPLLTRVTVDGFKYAWSLEEVLQWRHTTYHTWTTIVWPKFIQYYVYACVHFEQVWVYTYTTVAPLVGVKHITQSPPSLRPDWLNWKDLVSLCLTHSPAFVIQTRDSIINAWNTHILPNVPENLSETLPYAITSCILASLLVPWFLVQIDNFFEGLANRKSAFIKKMTKPARVGLKAT